MMDITVKNEEYKIVTKWDEQKHLSFYFLLTLINLPSHETELRHLWWTNNSVLKSNPISTALSIQSIFHLCVSHSF
jgi:hypothetical protein